MTNSNMPVLKPAAQYLRMSTDSQTCSLEQQASTIAEFAALHGYEIVQSYEDAGRSGVTSKGRAGLASLLADVVGGSRYKTVLVLDVSRWGRYQDPDEAAHYEFLCRSAGVSVRYCAEVFGDDFSAPIMKQLKRVMAGEYSRELSAKVRRGKRRQAERGFAGGGRCPYGLQRVEVLPDGTDGRTLLRHERKARPEYSVRFAPGPPEEQAVCRNIFSLYLNRKLPPHLIAENLHERGSVWTDGTRWTGQRVSRLLRCDLLAGRLMIGKQVNRLGQRHRIRPPSQWEMIATFEPTVPAVIFDAAQRRRTTLNGSRGLTEQELLHDLRQIVRKHGRCSVEHLERALGPGRSWSYFSKFGSLQAAYSRIGHQQGRQIRGSGITGIRADRSQMLEGLRALFDHHGRISTALLTAARHLPSPYAYRKEFGSLVAAYTEAGITEGEMSRAARRMLTAKAQHLAFPQIKD